MLIPCDHGDVAVWLDALQRADGTVEPEICVNQLHGDDPITSSQAKQIARAASYCSFVFDSPQLIQVLVSESAHLPEPERHRTRAAQYDYIAEWVTLVREVHPQWDVVHARIRVQAVQTMMNNIALSPHLRRLSDAESALVSIGAELLAISAQVPSQLGRPNETQKQNATSEEAAGTERLRS
jgi:hypothetical protein